MPASSRPGELSSIPPVKSRLTATGRCAAWERTRRSHASTGSLPSRKGKRHRAGVARKGVEGLRPVRWARVAGGGKLEPSCKRPVHGRCRGPGRSIGGHHVRARTGGHHRPSRSPAATPGHWAGLRAAEQRAALPGRSADGRGDHPRDARGGPGPYADRIRGLIAILWRAGLRISEALALTESDLDPKTESVLVRAGKGGKRRIVGMDDWAWEHVRRWTEHRIQLPVGPLFCILAGPTRAAAGQRPRPR